MPSVSIIVPVYNMLEYLPRFQQSLQMQSLTDYEVICVNDGSSDTSGAFLEAWASEDRRVRVLHQPTNLGAGAARNRAMAVAEGKTLCFADPDDTLPHDSLEVRYRAFVEHNAIIRGCYRKLSTDGSTLFCERVPAGLEGVLCPRHSAHALERNHFLAGHWTWLIPSALVRAHGIRNAEGTQTAEDIEFLVQLFFHIERCLCLPNIVYNWIVRAGSATNRIFNNIYYIDYLDTAESFAARARAFNSQEYGDLYADETIAWILQHMSFNIEHRTLSEEHARAVLRHMAAICSRYGIFQRFSARQKKKYRGFFWLRRALRYGAAGARRPVLPALLSGFAQLTCDNAPIHAFFQARQPGTAQNKVEKLHRLQKKLTALRARVHSCKPVIVLFIVYRASCWQYEGLYRLMEKSPLFQPYIGIAPFISFGMQDVFRNLDICHKQFSTTTYNIIESYERAQRTFIDFQSKISPDIVFFADPWQSTFAPYSIESYTSSINCYTPYGIYSANIQNDQYNKPFHRYLDFFFCETELHKAMGKRYGPQLGNSLVVTGYAKIDPLFDKNHRPGDPWKPMSPRRKRIIWAPHYTIQHTNETLGYSCFLDLHEFMLAVARRYERHVQFVFKPHPNLKPTLIFNASWGSKKTQQYWKRWETLSNGQVEEGEYLDLFLTSDAMILDSVSFISEYMATGKPSLFTVRDNSIYNKWNEYGKEAFSKLYHTVNLKRDIVQFIEHVVIAEKDEMKIQRDAFVRKYLVPPHTGAASQNIFTFFVDMLRDEQ